MGREGQRRNNGGPRYRIGVRGIVRGVEDNARVGQRVARLRKLRGLTQQQLSAAAHFSTSLVKQVEQGITPPSAAFVAGVSRALGVKPAYLYGTEERQIVEESRDVQLRELRAAIDSWDDPRPDGEPLTLEAINRRLDTAAQQVQQATSTRYADAATDLSVLLHHLYPLTDGSGRAVELARSALHDAYRLAASVAGRFRQIDLAAVASERHIQLAPHTGDPLRVTISAFHRSSLHLQHGDYAAGLRLLSRAQGHLNGPSPVATQMYLRCAVLAARSGDLGYADEYLGEARAARTDEHTGYWGIDASPLNIAVHWAALPVEVGNGAEAVRRGAQVHLDDTSRPERIGHHHIDQARAWFLHGNRDRCIVELNAARRASPFTTRHHPAVRETVLALATADRRATDSLAEFARWAGIAL